MADIVFNVAKGRVNELVSRVDAEDPAASGLVVVLLQAVETDATIQDYDTLAALLAGSNSECDFTNYERKVLTESNISAPTPDDTNNRQDADIPDQTWTSAGGATNNDIVKLIVCYAPDTEGADSTFIPLTAHDFVISTNGSNIVAQINASGFYRAS